MRWLGIQFITFTEVTQLRTLSASHYLTASLSKEWLLQYTMVHTMVFHEKLRYTVVIYFLLYPALFVAPNDQSLIITGSAVNIQNIL